jgi:secreted trypsin-like serine protease
VAVGAAVGADPAEGVTRPLDGPAASGTCYGDSGGPNFLGAGATETNLIAGITVTGDVFCRSTNTTYRLDSAAARTFLGDFVALP